MPLFDNISELVYLFADGEVNSDGTRLDKDYDLTFEAKPQFVSNLIDEAQVNAIIQRLKSNFPTLVADEGDKTAHDGAVLFFSQTHNKELLETKAANIYRLVFGKTFFLPANRQIILDTLQSLLSKTKDLDEKIKIEARGNKINQLMTTIAHEIITLHSPKPQETVKTPKQNHPRIESDLASRSPFFIFSSHSQFKSKATASELKAIHYIYLLLINAPFLEFKTDSKFQMQENGFELMHFIDKITSETAQRTLQEIGLDSNLIYCKPLIKGSPSYHLVLHEDLLKAKNIDLFIAKIKEILSLLKTPSKLGFYSEIQKSYEATTVLGQGIIEILGLAKQQEVTIEKTMATS